MWWELFNDEIAFLARHLLRLSIISFSSIGIVYIFHRQLGINMGYRVTNALAIVASIVLSYYSILIYDINRLVTPMELYWRTAIYTSLSSIVFVTVGWHLYDRVDHFLDKKFSPDEEPKARRRKK